MTYEEYVKKELEDYLLLAKKYNIEINGKNFVDIIEILGGFYFGGI